MFVGLVFEYCESIFINILKENITLYIMPYSLQIQVNSSHMKEKYQNAIDIFNVKKGNAYRDSGFDLFVPVSFESFHVKHGLTYTIKHGVSCCVYKDGVPSGYYLYPRSSLSKTPFRLANSVGIIDSGYRGDIMAKVDRISDVKYVVDVGDRLFQLCTPTLEPFDSIEIVEQFDNETERGTGGFGSSGV